MTHTSPAWPQQEPGALWQNLGLSLLLGVFQLCSGILTLQTSPSSGRAQTILQRSLLNKSQHMM